MIGAIIAAMFGPEKLHVEKSACVDETEFLRNFECRFPDFIQT